MEITELKIYSVTVTLKQVQDNQREDVEVIYVVCQKYYVVYVYIYFETATGMLCFGRHEQLMVSRLNGRVQGLTVLTTH